MHSDHLFSLLKLRVLDSVDSLSVEERAKVTFFKESVDVLEHYSKFFEDVKTEKNSVIQRFLKSEVEAGIFDQDTYLYFNKLLTNTSIFTDGGYVFSQMKSSAELQEFIRNIHNGIKHFSSLNRNEAYSNLSLDLKENFDNLKNDPFTLNQIKYLKNWVEDNHASICWNLEYERRKSRLENINRCSYFDQIISFYLEINVLCLDINLKNPFGSPEQDFRRMNFSYGEKVEKYLNNFSNFLSGFFKWENDHHHGLNLHCILFFDGKEKFSSKKVIDQLTKNISQDKFDSGITITNWLNKSKKITKQDFSKISYQQTELISQFKYWILGYYDYIDQLMRLKYENNSGDPLPVNGEFLRFKNALFADPLVIRKDNIEFWKKTIGGKDPQKTWQYHNLSKPMIERIEVAKLIYAEYANMDTNFSDLAEVALRLEIFLENLLGSRGVFFDYPRELKEGYSFTSDEWTYSITLSCRQYFNLIQDHAKVQRLLKFAESNRLSPLICVVNFALIRFFSKIDIEEIFNLNLQKTIELNKAVSILSDRYLGNSVNQRWLRNRINSNYLEMNKQLAIEEQHKICARRYEIAVDYSNAIFTQDIVIYRIQFSLDLKTWGRIPQAEFSKLFTSFIRFGKRAQPLSKCTGYLGCWSLTEGKQTIADVLFFFPRDAFTKLDDISALVISYWNQFLTKHFDSKSKSDFQYVADETKSIGLFLSQPEFDSKYVVISAKDKNKQNLLKQTVVRYLCYLEAFQPRPADPIRKVLIKGSTAKVIKVNN